MSPVQVQFHNNSPTAQDEAELWDSLLACIPSQFQEGRQRDRPALRYLPLAGLRFHLPKARQGPTQQAGEELARAGLQLSLASPLVFLQLETISCK